MLAHFYILNNTDIVLPYIIAQKEFVKRNNPRMSEKWMLNEHNKNFMQWFQNKVGTNTGVLETLQRLALGPNFDVFTFSAYDINNYTFYTKTQDDKSTMQNSGVMIVAESEHFATRHDKNLVTASMSYFGVIEDIWEVDYGPFKVPVFKCKWVDINNGVKVDENDFTMVDLNRIGHRDEPFIMASQVKQVFYVTDAVDNIWSMVIHGTSNHLNVEEADAMQTPSLPNASQSFHDVFDVDYVHAVRDDHEEGIWDNTTLN
ncbi:hypothetical protein Fmac_013550 [Flemingia macrophylla]|uniref:DUF4216 domain-containing protein n=1 Tax=Flemingia macrophylla TaxID=520843 RepID=A0ABD1MTF8_9FABA